ncbi:hypothetical protein [Serratia marcescens]|uniref:Uncharacterized protein n=1 Tax=Serratia marcescens TaxID=615 RepID=A0ABD5IES5_SERMA|nr:hypothetical protein [Serratia marcescens]MDX7082540.1 hypothetical protein [Serratia marcescens]
MDKLHEEKLRAEFEKQIREDLLFDDEELEWQPERNCYAIYGVHLAWWGYRASRVNLVVELPEPHAHLIWIQAGHAPDDYWDDVEISRSEEDKCCDGSDRYEVYAKWQVDELFRSIGLSIKGDEA